MTLAGKLDECDSDEKLAGKTSQSSGSADLDNSMLVTNVSRAESTDNSFLEAERLCRLQEEMESELNSTMLFDVEPPSGLWNQSMVTFARGEEKGKEESGGERDLEPSDQLSEGDESEEDEQEVSIDIPMLQLVAMNRPSTIIEETSSQCLSTLNRTPDEASKGSELQSEESSTSHTSLAIQRPESCVSFKEKAKQRETLVFKHRKFFTDDDRESTNSPVASSQTSEQQTPREKSDLILFDENSSTPSRKFNDTLEEIDFFMENGKTTLNQTPLTQRNKNVSILPTPLFSCKRSRVLSELATREAFPMSKRGPLLDLFGSPNRSGNPQPHPWTDPTHHEPT